MKRRAFDVDCDETAPLIMLLVITYEITMLLMG